jgi:signal transduction histidine kinase
MTSTGRRKSCGGTRRPYLAHQKELLAVLAATAAQPDVERRLEEAVLDAASLGRVMLVGPQTAADQRPGALSPEQLGRALSGQEVHSDVYLEEDTTPAMALCLPARGLPQHAVCAELDLLELWRFVQDIRVGETGYALVFADGGQLLASGVGALRGAILTGEPVPQSAYTQQAIRGEPGVPTRYQSAGSEAVVAGWARLPEWGWAMAVEQPVREALQSARAAQWGLWGVLLLALLLSLAVGVWQAQRVLRELEVEERWRTAGRIAAGITHDLGHRLRTLQQTAALADSGEPLYLPVIRDNLKSEVATLKKFVADFSDLSRDVGALEAFPLELSAFLESVGRAAAPHAEAAGVRLETASTAAPLWVRADRHLLERALLNLLSNAIEASPAGAVVRLSALPQGAQQCTILVEDRGSGIAPERLPRLFDAFVTTKRTGAHLGMGLPNVKRIVEAHQGTVAVNSQLGEGTTFRITLPAAAAPEVGAISPSQSGSSSSASSSGARP